MFSSKQINILLLVLVIWTNKLLSKYQTNVKRKSFWLKRLNEENCVVIAIIVKHGPPSFEAQKSGLNNSEMVWVLMMAEWTLKLGLSLVRVSYWPNLRYNYDYSSSHKKVSPLITLQEKFWNLSFRDKVCFQDTDPFYLFFWNISNNISYLVINFWGVYPL